MNEKLIELAGLLGVAVENLWNALIKQAFIDVWITIIQWIFLVLVSYKLIGNLHSKMVNADNASYDDEDKNLWIWVGITTIRIIVFIDTILIIYDVPTQLLNPEYWALKQILNK